MPLLRKRYYSVNGVLIGERTTGQERVHYMPDPLGNVTAVQTTSGGVKTATYTPTGSGTPPTGATMGWVGAHGYRPQNLPESSHYMIHRSYSDKRNRWNSVDMLWPEEAAYAYVAGRSISNIDPSGQGPRCMCVGRRGIISGYPTSGKYYSCYAKWCSMLCPGPPDPIVAAESLCKGPLDCAKVYGEYPVCASGPIWEACGKYYTIPSGNGYNGAPANDSNYPKPSWQWAVGKPMCCVECKMRICCALSYDLVEWEALVQRGFMKCRRKGRV